MEPVASGSGTSFEKRKREESPGEDMFTSKRKQTWFYVLGPESDKDSDRAESVWSVQDKSTDYVRDSSDTSTKSSWSYNGDMVQYEVVSLSEGENPHPFPSNGDSSSNPEDILGSKISMKIDILSGSNSSVDTSSNSSSDGDSELSHADFWACVKCKAKNNNPMFRYCERCYKVRKNFFPPRPRGKKHRKPRRPHSERQEQESSGIGSSVGDSHLSNSIESVSPSCIAEVETIPRRTDIAVSEISDLCETCFLNPKDGGYVHTNIIHIYNCYQCSLKILKQRGSCPICNVRVSKILKVVKY